MEKWKQTLIDRLLGIKGHIGQAALLAEASYVSNTMDVAVGIVKNAAYKLKGYIENGVSDKDALLELIEGITSKIPYEVDQMLHVQIGDINQNGAFCETLEGYQGLIHVSEIVPGKRIAEVTTYLRSGETVNARLKRIAPDGKLSFSVTHLFADQAEPQVAATTAVTEEVTRQPETTATPQITTANSVELAEEFSELMTFVEGKLGATSTQARTAFAHLLNNHSTVKVSLEVFNILRDFAPDLGLMVAEEVQKRLVGKV